MSARPRIVVAWSNVHAEDSSRNGTRIGTRSFTEALSLDGHSFELCHTGAEVEAALRRDLPDIVIADVDLPDLDAFELVAMLTEIAAGRAIPPVVIRSN